MTGAEMRDRRLETPMFQKMMKKRMMTTAFAVTAVA
jgi:N-acetylmuramoyl-L-alanine amidase